MLIQQLIAVLFLMAVSSGCTNLQKTSKNAMQIESMTNDYLTRANPEHSAFGEIESIRAEVMKIGISYFEPTFLPNHNYIFVSQSAFTRGEIDNININKVIDSLTKEYTLSFANKTIAFTQKELKENPTRGTRFYDLSQFNPKKDNLAVIVYDEFTLRRHIWPNEQEHNDAVAFSLLHEIGHSLAGIDGSPIYDYMKTNITTDKRKLNFYKEGYADWFATDILFNELPEWRFNNIISNLITFRKNTFTHHSHNTATILASYLANSSQKNGIANMLSQ